MVPEPDGYGPLVASGPTHSGLDAVHRHVPDVRRELRPHEDVEADSDKLLVRDEGELLVAVQGLCQFSGPLLCIFRATIIISN